LYLVLLFSQGEILVLLCCLTGFWETCLCIVSRGERWCDRALFPPQGTVPRGKVVWGHPG
jgi:hypothetical protein